MTSASVPVDRAVPGQGLQERAQADLVPGLRRLRRRPGDLPRARRGRAPAARDRVRLRHRLLEPDPRLHHGLRLQQRARPRAADRAGDQARQPRAAGARRGRRRRRLLDRRRPRGARGAPQHGPHLHRDGQPDLRAHQGAALADLAARAAHRVLVVGQPRGPGEPAAVRARLRGELRRAGHAGRHAGPRRGDRGGDPLSRASRSSTCSRRASPTGRRTSSSRPRRA